MQVHDRGDLHSSLKKDSERVFVLGNTQKKSHAGLNKQKNFAGNFSK